MSARFSSNQPTLFEAVGGGLSEGRVCRDRGVRAVEMAEWRQDRAIIDRVILLFADGGTDFTSDDVYPYLSRGIRPASVGAAFLRAARKGYIEEVGMKHSERPEARSRKITLWRGTHVEDGA